MITFISRPLKQTHKADIQTLYVYPQALFVIITFINGSQNLIDVSVLVPTP